MSSNNLRNNELEFTPTFGTQQRITHRIRRYNELEYCKIIITDNFVYCVSQ